MIGTQVDEELPDVGWFEDTLDDDDEEEDGSNMFVGVVFSAVVMTVEEEEKTGLFTAMEGELFRDNFCAFSAFKRSFNA